MRLEHPSIHPFTPTRPIRPWPLSRCPKPAIALALAPMLTFSARGSIAPGPAALATTVKQLAAAADRDKTSSASPPPPLAGGPACAPRPGAARAAGLAGASTSVRNAGHSCGGSGAGARVERRGLCKCVGNRPAPTPAVVPMSQHWQAALAPYTSYRTSCTVLARPSPAQCAAPGRPVRRWGSSGAARQGSPPWRACGWGTGAEQ